MDRFALSDTQKQELASLGVSILYLFGSHAEGVAGEGSDIDVGIVFGDPTMTKGNTLDLYNTLYGILAAAFSLSGDRTIDIVFLERAGLELTFDVITHGRILFESDTDARLAYEDRIASLYRDFHPVLTEMNASVLARV